MLEIRADEARSEVTCSFNPSINARLRRRQSLYRSSRPRPVPRFQICSPHRNHAGRERFSRLRIARHGVEMLPNCPQALRPSVRLLNAQRRHLRLVSTEPSGHVSGAVGCQTLEQNLRVRLNYHHCSMALTNELFFYRMVEKPSERTEITGLVQ
jgi:hypothetical protein